MSSKGSPKGVRASNIGNREAREDSQGKSGDLLHKYDPTLTVASGVQWTLAVRRKVPDGLVCLHDTPVQTKHLLGGFMPKQVMM